MKTKLPKSPGATSSEYSGFVCDQDRGGAIRSAGRADLFLGTGEEAERLAGQAKSEGRLYYVFLKQDQVAAATAQLNAAKSAAQPAAAKKSTKPSGLKAK